MVRCCAIYAPAHSPGYCCPYEIWAFQRLQHFLSFLVDICPVLILVVGGSEQFSFEVRSAFRSTCFCTFANSCVATVFEDMLTTVAAMI